MISSRLKLSAHFLAGDLLQGADVPLLLQPQRHHVHLDSRPDAAADSAAAAHSPPQAAVDAALTAARQVKPER